MPRDAKREWRIGVIDVETTPIFHGYRPRTRFWGCAVEGAGYQRFKTSAELVAYLQRASDRGIKLRLLHHHDFDPCQLIVDGIVPDAMLLRGARIVRCRVGGTEWINSFALFPDKLAKILEACGYRKLPLGCPEHEHLKPHLIPHDVCRECWRALEARNASDCVEALESFLRLGAEYEAECGIDPVRDGYATAASAAFAAAEMHAGPLPERLDRREAYRGGRVEAFRLGQCGEADSWDINSSYPYAFVDLPERDYMLKVRVSVERTAEPTPFFVDNERDEGLLFPYGDFETWIFASSYERYIRPHGLVTRMKILDKSAVDLRWLKRVAPVLSRVYEKRKTAPEAVRYALKIFMNSTYGRLGMRPQRTVCSRGATVPKGSPSYFRLGEGDFLSFREIPARVRANYPLAAAITDNARARLYDMMRRVPTLYCDTDSVYIPHGTRVPFEPSKALGAWKPEGTGKLMIRTVKDYEFAGTVKRKGGASSTLWTVRLALSNKGVRKVDKRRISRYEKRRVMSGGTTMPHRL